MTAHTLPRYRLPRKPYGLVAAVAALVVLIAAATAFVSYLLWPTWPRTPVALDAPAIPVTVAGVLFNVPPAAIRAAVERHAGAHERIDLMFLWPSLDPPAPDSNAPGPMAVGENGELPAPHTDDRLFVTITGLGAVLPPAERLRTIYPRYIAAQATAGPNGLAAVPFRAGTPYESEDLVYVADKPEQFFVRCSRPVRTVPGTCMQERLLDAAEMTLRFPRVWLQDWRNVASGFDRLVAQLRAPGR
jgi:hypothetical protein